MSATRKHEHPIMDDYFGPLKQHVIAATGLSYFCSRDQELGNHFAKRFRQTGITECRAYLQLLESGAAGNEELDNLIEELTIGETYFFRHPQLFNAVEQTILPDAIERNRQHRRLRIWSAGASIGAEAYTMSILLRRQLAHRIPDWEVTIIGTDINRSFLARAAKAQFEDWALRGVSDEIRQQCFSRCDKYWTINTEFQNGVSFQYHNLVEHPFPSMLHNLFAFDVILCRNVMIYFSNPEIARIVRNMHDCLVDGGWLLVGHAEHALERFRDFRAVPLEGTTAYQRIDAKEKVSSGSHRQLEYGATVAAPFTVNPSVDSIRTHPRQLVPQETIQPGDPVDEFALIRQLADRGELEWAAARCEGLLKAHKLDPTCYLYHALILEQLGQHSACEQALRRAIYLDREFVLAHYYLGLTMQRLGRRAEATRSLHNARQLLAKVPPDRVIQDSDGLTAAELTQLTCMQLDAMT